MKRIYLILGDSSVGKSSLIRCLTGIRTENRVRLRLIDGSDIYTWCWMRSAQEQPMDIDEMINQIFEVGENGFIYYLLPLRLSPAGSCPGYLEYVNALKDNNCIIENSALLTNNSITINLSPIISPVIIVNSKDNPVNLNANTVRNSWGWI